MRPVETTITDDNNRKPKLGFVSSENTRVLHKPGRMQCAPTVSAQTTNKNLIPRREHNLTGIQTLGYRLAGSL